jgi:predicted hotdog family 3-hydroxylacyl-ACP dehydratase
MEIEALIPHRDRMRLIGEVMAVDDDRAVTSSAVTEEWPLYCDGSVDTLVTIELVAQTAAILEGWKRLQSGRGGASGWLVGIKTADFRLPRVPLHATLITEARKDYAMESYAVFEGTVRMGTEVVAVVSMQAFRPEGNT